MGNNFTKGMILGGILTASMGMMMNSDMTRTRRKMMKSGRNMVKKSGNIVGDVVDLFR